MEPLAGDEAREQRAACRAGKLGRVRGRELAEMRKSAGLSQADFAKALGVRQVRISPIEHGRVDSLDTLRAHAEARGPLTLRLVLSR